MKDMKTEWKSKDDIRKQWFLTDCEIVFHSCFDCAYKALQISGCRKKTQGPVWKKLTMNSGGICMFLLAHSVVCVSNVLFSMSLIRVLIQLINHLL